jgi:hypothetical protein
MNFGYYQKLAKRTNDNNVHLVNLENCIFCYGQEFTSKEIEAFLMTGQPLIIDKNNLFKDDHFIIIENAGYELIAYGNDITKDNASFQYYFIKK